MPAYFVAVRNSVTDPDEMKIYGAKAIAARGDHRLKALAAYGRLRSTDGRPTDGAVLIEFESFEAAEAWYDSPEYQEAVQHRFKGGDYQTFIIDGV